jgi:hypothetical protein
LPDLKFMTRASQPYANSTACGSSGRRIATSVASSALWS